MMIYSLQALIQVFVPFLIILALFFIVYIFISKSRKISIRESLRKDMPNLINIISVLLVFVTLLEMQMERVQAYKPFIVLETGTGGCTFEINEGSNSQNQFAVFDTNYSDASLSGDVKIPIKNIGMGVANKLELVFTIDFSANTQRYFLFEDKYQAFNLEDYKDNNEIIVDRRYMETNTFLNAPDIDVSEEQLHYQSFILPDNQETLYVRLPVDYLAAIRHYMAYSHDIDVPPLYLTVKYEDIQGVKYSQKFYLALSARYTINKGIQDYALYYTFTPEEGISVEFGGNSQSEFPEQYDYSKISSQNGFLEESFYSQKFHK